MLSDGLERMAGGRLEGALKKMTSNRFKSLALGAGITMAIQSSSAVTVMLVGLVSSGIMTIGQSIGVIMGSNIGTTMTAWILTLIGVESDNFIMSLAKPENFSLIFAFAGILMIMVSKNDKRKNLGSIFVGFAILMYGMKLMSGAVKPLADNPAFTSLFTAFRNPLLGVLVGLVVTAVIQSSSASVGILQALALTGSVSYGAAIPIIMGQNIGTCVTAMISSMGASKNARKVAVVHVAFNLLGTTVCLILYALGDALFQIPILDQPIDAVGIATVHTLFNVFTTCLLLPFTRQLEALANRILPETAEEKARKQPLLDERLLATPSVAIAEAELLSVKMANVARDSLVTALGLLTEYSDSLFQQILSQEKEVDRYEDTLGSYLVKLSAVQLSETDSRKVSRMLHSIGDMERLSDHAVNLAEAAKELRDKNLSFSETARKELGLLRSALEQTLDLTVRCYENNNVTLAACVEPMEETVDDLVAGIKARHIERLQSGECSIELGFILSDLLNDAERVSDHCSNIAVAVIELTHGSFAAHKYLHKLRDGKQFQNAYHAYARKYDLNNL